MRRRYPNGINKLGLTKVGKSLHTLKNLNVRFPPATAEQGVRLATEGQMQERTCDDITSGWVHVVDDIRIRRANNIKGMSMHYNAINYEKTLTHRFKPTHDGRGDLGGVADE
jgi:hypothetical protein